MTYSTKVVGETDAGIPIFRIDFDSGHWWELHSERTWGTGQAIRMAAAGFDSDEDKQLLELRNATNMAGLLGSTVRWSWDVPCTADEIEGLSEYEVRIASRELASLHLAEMVKLENDEKKVLRGHWLWVIRSRITGSMSTLIKTVLRLTFIRR